MTNDGARSAEMFQLIDDHNFKGLLLEGLDYIFSKLSRASLFLATM